MIDINAIIKDSMQNDSSVSMSDDVVKKETSIKIEIIIFISVILLVVWSSFAELDITVSTRGELIQLNDMEKIQHLEGGILDELLIKEGDLVYEGQPIAMLKAIERNSEFDVMNIEIAGLNLDIERLKSLIENRAPDFSEYTAYPNIVLTTQKSWMAEKSKNTSNEGIIKHDINNKNTLIKSMRNRIKSANAQLKLIEEQLKIKQQLYDEDVASYVDVLNMKVQRMNMVREIQNLDEAVVSEVSEVNKLKKTLTDANFTRMSEYRTELTQKEKDRLMKYSHLPRVADRVDRLTVYSPVDGKVDKVHFNYISAIISPGESIADIVPLKSSLIAEAKIPKKDIGFVEVGQKARIKIDTYSFASYGAVEGVITSISRTPYEEKEELYYFAKIEFETEYLEKGSVKHYLTPHMEFTADIKTGSRKIIDYAVKPVVTALEDAFDER